MTTVPKQKIGYLVSTYPAISHTYILREIRKLRQLNIDIKVASINPEQIAPQGMTPEEKEECNTTYYVKKTPLPKILFQLVKTLIRSPLSFLQGFVLSVQLNKSGQRKPLYSLYYFVEAILVGQWMQTNNLSHLHVHFANAASAVALLVERIFHHSFSIMIHGPDEFYDVTRLNLETKLSSARFLCCIGEYARSQIMKLTMACHWPKINITPLGVNLKTFSPKPFNENPAVFQILCVSRLVQTKGTHILLAAAERLLEQGYRLQVRIIGDGPCRDSLELEAQRRGIASNVIFLGAINQHHILDFYQQADLFVLPSFAEGIPVVLMEAMAMEIPCIATWVNGIPELIRHNVDGLLVAPSSEQELASTMALLMDDPHLRRQLGAAGRARIAQKYELQANVEHLAKVFKIKFSNEKSSVSNRPQILTGRGITGSLNT